MSVNGGSETFIADMGDGFWARSYDVAGDHVYYLKVNENKYVIERTNLISHKKQIIDEIDADYVSFLSVTPDERSLIFCKLKETESDVILVENFR